ncbi:MAG: cell division protein FtsX, partial [Solirubrobacterales bacterium]
MSRLIFFFQEAFRALRRNGAPTLAAIVTTVVTVTLLGVLIPIFQTTQAKSDEVRGELNIQASVFDDATKAELLDLRQELLAIPDVNSVQFITKNEALKELEESLGAEKADELTSALNTNPLPASFKITPNDAANLPAIERAIEPQKDAYFSPIVS